MLKKFLLFILVVATSLGLVSTLFATWGYYFLTRDLPHFSRIEDYKPPAVTQVLSRDGTLMAEFYTERRYPVKLIEVPDMVRKAFLAAEDASFYSHHGIDPVSIARAIYKNLQSGNVKQGASTITQQVVKNLLLTPEKSLIRKAKEAILSYRLELRFKKDEIFEIYLNQIFFGNSAYGLKAAATIYFHKNLSELTLAEAALLAGLPKGPSSYSPLRHMDRAKRRQAQVLKQMEEAGFISASERLDARTEELHVYPASQKNIFASPYYVGEIRRKFAERWDELDIDSEGLTIETAVDTTADLYAQRALQEGLRAVDKRRGWRGPVSHMTEQEYSDRYGDIALPEDEPLPAFVTSVLKHSARVRVASKELTVDLSKARWAKKFLRSDESYHFVNPLSLLKTGDIIEVTLHKTKDKLVATLDQTPELEGALVLLDPFSGEVLAMAGGYDYSKSQFNRVTQGLRQPGSSFKPVVYLTAVDKFKYTPATIVSDAPRTFRVGDDVWTPGNYDGTFLGGITLRTALERSRNLVSADIVSRIGVDSVIDYARRLGITSPLGRNLSLSLGSSEVAPLEIARAYGAFPAKGILRDSVFITKITDRFGRVVYDFRSDGDPGRRAIDEDSAFIMANMMRGVVERGTGRRVSQLKRPAAGKTGTSNDQMDAWFVGYTPRWVCGVWVGFDQKKTIGPKETGGAVSAPIWLNFMKQFIERQEELVREKIGQQAKEEAELLGVSYQAPAKVEAPDFLPTDGVEPYWISKEKGYRVSPSEEGAFLEYFIKGTEPEQEPRPVDQDGVTSTSSYLESPDL